MTAAPVIDTVPPRARFQRRVPRWKLRLSAWLPVLTTSVILLSMFIAGQTIFGNFFTSRLISSLFLDNAYLIVLAVGMTYVILTGGIDLSVGAVVAFSGIFGAELLQTGWPAIIVIPAIVLSGSVIGALVGVLVQIFEIQAFIASLAAMFLARGLAYVVSLQSIPITDPAVIWLERTRFQIGGGWFVTPTVIIALVTVLVSVWILQYTRFGRSVYAIGGNEQSARLMGLQVAKTRIAVYIISGTCAGIAGLIFAAYTGSGYSLTGIGMELDAIAAVVIGGTILTGGSGYIIGSLFGVMVYGLIEISITYIGVDSWWTKIVVGGLLLVFVVLQRVLVARPKR